MPRVAPLRQPPLGFAHRGARAHAAENTLDAFRLAVDMGATGIESDVWITADGVPVLDHDGVVGRLRRRAINRIDRADLPSHLPALAELYAAIGPDHPLSLDVKDVAAFEATVAVAEDAGADGNLWLCHHDWRVAAGWRSRSDRINLVDSTRIDRIKEGPERRAKALSDAGIGTVNLHHTDWSGGLTTLFHRFGVECFAWDAQLDRTLAEVLVTGVDAVYSDHVDRMMAVIDGLS